MLDHVGTYPEFKKNFKWLHNKNDQKLPPPHLRSHRAPKEAHEAVEFAMVRKDLGPERWVHMIYFNSSKWGKYMEVSWNRGTPKSSIFVGFSILNQPFLGIPHLWKHQYILYTCAVPKWESWGYMNPQSLLMTLSIWAYTWTSDHGTYADFNKTWEYLDIFR
jgi:hypothetical protein